MTKTDGERLAVLEEQMEGLLGNGQPGAIQQIWKRLETHGKLLYLGAGIIICLQGVTAVLISLIAAGVLKVR